MGLILELLTLQKQTSPLLVLPHGTFLEIAKIWIDPIFEVFVMRSSRLWVCCAALKSSMSLVSHFLQSILGLWSSKQGNPRTTWRLGLLMMLKKIIQEPRKSAQTPQ